MPELSDDSGIPARRVFRRATSILDCEPSVVAPSTDSGGVSAPELSKVFARERFALEGLANDADRSTK